MKPIALSMPISFTYSSKFPLIDEEREKKHKNIVIPIRVPKIPSRIRSTISKVL